MTDPGQERLEALVHGRVQGVGYRWYVVRLADRLQLAGWVANQADGSVRCVAEGSRGSLETLLAGLRAGPAGARVDRITETWLAATGGFDGFDVRSGGHRGD
jgi:acylphosphatase